MIGAYIFVYGTLMPGTGHPMSDWLKSFSTFVCEGTVPGRLYRIGNYPGAMYDFRSESVIHGVILEIEQELKILKVLDEYEEIGMSFSIPNEFRREKLLVLGSDLIKRLCWTYLYNLPVKNLNEISKGEF